MIYKGVAAPKKRSAARKKWGKKIFTVKRYLQWHLSRKKFARSKGELLECRLVRHSSILLRKLKDVDMQLQRNKIENLRLAIQPIDRLIIGPGEIFSFWYLVGNPTSKRGYQLGMVLENGEVRSGYGGGLCQLANLLYWMTIHTPLTVTERWRHSFDVFPDVNRTIPFGCGATVSYNYIDLQIRNTTRQSFQLHLWLTAEELCGEIRSDKDTLYRYRIEERNHRIHQEISGHYTRHNQIVRHIFEKSSDHLVRTELLTENHAFMMYSPLIQQKN